MKFDIYKLQRFNFILDTVSEGWWDNNFETGKIYWSTNLFRMQGIERDESFVDMKFFESQLHPDDAPFVVSEFERCVNEDIPFEYELRLKHSTLGYISCITRAKGYHDDKGKVLGYAGLVTELTHKVMEQEAMKRKNLQLESLNKISKTISSRLKLDELVQEVTDITTGLVGADFGAFFYNMKNEKGEYFTLYTISGAPKEAFSNFPMPRNTEVFKPTFEGTATVISDDILKDPRYGKSSPYYGMPEGHLPVRSYLAVPVVSPNEEPIGGLFFGHHNPGVFDSKIIPLIEGIASQSAIAIENARLYTEKELSETNFRMLAESIPQMVAVLDSHGQLEYVNKRWHEYTGLTFEDAKHGKARELVHPDDLEEFLSKREDSLNTGKNFEYEFRLKRQDGKYKWHLTRMAPITDQENNIVKWVSATTDIDDQKKAEEKKDEFMGIASHELKTPLTSIKAYMQLIQRSTREMDNNKLSEYVDRANSNIDKLSGIISDLLDVSKIQSGKLIMNLEIFNFKDLVEEVAEGMQYTSYNHEIITKELKDINVYADRQRIEQVMINFISNAIKYSPDCGTVILRTVVPDNSLVFSVTDCGIGISKENIRYIFDKYFRVHNPTEDFSGIGIGLYISSEIVKRHKGKIWVESEEGRGSTFNFQIPLNTNA
jgi:PAS domain S-box-containing protein